MKDEKGHLKLTTIASALMMRRVDYLKTSSEYATGVTMASNICCTQLITDATEELTR